MNRLLTFLVSASLSLILVACGSSTPKTSAFVSGANATALAATSDGGLIYASANGEIRAVAENGATSTITKLEGMDVDKSRVMGLFQDKSKRTFASWVEPKTGRLIVAEVSPAPTRVVYSADFKSAEPSGKLGMTPENRLLVSMHGQDGTDHIVSVDPDRNDDQRANEVSKNWKDIGGFAYAAGGVLWVADNTDADVRISRAGPDGAIGKVTSTRPNDSAFSMTTYGDSEFAICFGDSRTLQRYYISDGVTVLSGRVLARDCSGDVVQLAGGRAAYVANGDIRATAL